MQHQAKHPYRVILADDHAPYRDYLRCFFSKESDLEILGEAGDGLELLEILRQLEIMPEMAIIDFTMPLMGGIELIAAIKRNYPAMKVLILSGHLEQEYVRGALAAGADGYLLKESADTELSHAIDKIKQNEIYLPKFFRETPEEEDDGSTN